jgi:hypothetical protein
MLQRRQPFHDIGANEYEERERQREIARLQKRAMKIGLSLVNMSTQTILG